MTKFLTRVRKFLSWKTDEFSKRAVRRLTQALKHFTSAEADSFKERQIGIFAHCLIFYPALRIQKLLAVKGGVENHYDNISGSYVKNLTENSRKKWGVVDGEVKESTYAQYCIDGMHERMQCMEEHGPFETMLEVGAGELTTYSSLIDVMTQETPELYAIDLSLNRLRHGRAFAKSRNFQVHMAKASAFALPYPDNSFDVVFTSHCLEWMPKKMFKQAVDEICRVSKKHVFLFEPTYEYSTALQKFKMRTHSYMRGLVPYLQRKPGISIQRSSLMKYSYNAFNQTSCHHLLMNNSNNVQNTVSLACPSCKSTLQHDNGSYFCYACQLGYPTFDDIPVLDIDYAIGVSQIS